MRLRRNVGRVALSSVVLSLVVTAVATFGASPAVASPSSCATATVLVHDLASSEREWDGWLGELDARGLCAFAFTYGSSEASMRWQAVTERTGLGEVAGVTRFEDSAAEFGAFVDSVSRQVGVEQVQVLAHGAGGLVAQQWMAHYGARSVRTVVTVGPLWNGTDVAGLGSLAAFNRSVGIYDDLAALEKPVLEPICAACGQIVANSGYIHDAARTGWVLPGVRYVNVMSRYDGLMTDPLSAAVPGAENWIVQDLDADDRTDHLQLMHNPLVRRLALSALAVG